MLRRIPSELEFLSEIEQLKDNNFHLLHAEYDSYLVPHEQGVAKLVYLICQQMGIDEGKATQISVAARFHDIGKLAIPDSILLKPGKLTLEEREIMHQHAAVGYQILSKFQGSSIFILAAQIALEHHEKFDGSGYPNGLIGEAISLESRIVTICDCYDALRRSRPYREGLEHGVVLEILCQERQSFDPDVFEAFFSIEPRISEYLKSWDAGLMSS